ncbi:response regulator transcription factor [Anaerosinus gibii]|uniref:Response regulator transcription factor n=1 Tax=Selenobaculum gibii TaxID=3054208 RepID=A0A9Y2AHY9_9FIRM|nr:response regulator transcription factor [Selenobaculum gbiensis]WIW70439.1 response regulator transcription factor [Selenobaculum gbiensis]
MNEVKQKIVIVDDDDIALNILKNSLSDLYDVYSVCDGLKSIEVFKKVMPDLILLDIMMPDIDGISIYIAQNQNPILDKIPVIFVSAIDDIEYKVQLLEWGINDYITKPYNIEEVRARIKRTLHQAQEKRLLEQNLKILQNK